MEITGFHHLPIAFRPRDLAQPLLAPNLAPRSAQLAIGMSSCASVGNKAKRVFSGVGAVRQRRGWSAQPGTSRKAARGALRAVVNRAIGRYDADIQPAGGRTSRSQALRRRM
jgi:hypothetical protein